LVRSVAAEVLVFFVIGPALVTRLTPAGALAIAALAGMLRWAVMAQTTDVIALALVQAAARHHFAAASSRLHASDRPPPVPQGSKGRRRRSTVRRHRSKPPHCLILVSGALYARLGAQGFGHGCRCARLPSR